MPLAAGSLDRKIVIERSTESRDEMNEPVLMWAQLARVSASYEPIRDGEKFRAGETAAGLSARFVIRYSSQVADVDPKDRVIFGGNTYAILGVKESHGRCVGIELTCGARGDGA